MNRAFRFTAQAFPYNPTISMLAKRIDAPAVITILEGTLHVQSVGVDIEPRLASDLDFWGHFGQPQKRILIIKNPESTLFSHLHKTDTSVILQFYATIRWPVHFEEWAIQVYNHSLDILPLG